MTLRPQKKREKFDFIFRIKHLQQAFSSSLTHTTFMPQFFWSRAMKKFMIIWQNIMPIIGLCYVRVSTSESITILWLWYADKKIFFLLFEEPWCSTKWKIFMGVVRKNGIKYFFSTVTNVWKYRDWGFTRKALKCCVNEGREVSCQSWFLLFIWLSF